MDTIQLTPDVKQNCPLTLNVVVFLTGINAIVQNNTNSLMGLACWRHILYLSLDVVPFCSDSYPYRGTGDGARPRDKIGQQRRLRLQAVVDIFSLQIVCRK